MQLGQKYITCKKFIENILFVFFLIGYPLLKINKGIDVSDTTYSLSNFQFFDSMDGTWIVATFLANAVGSLLMHLPFGNMLMGMYFYTALIQSFLAVIVYLALRRRIPAPLVFIGEMAALGLCWCPSLILYNYLTYLLMTAGVLFLYYGVLKENGRNYYLAAGVCLGANVAVRMPNVVQTAFIIVVWYGIILLSWRENDGVRSGSVKPRGLFCLCLQDTLWCVAGYLVGFGIPFIAICLKYGVNAYPDMVRTMFKMTENAADYKPVSMLAGMFGDYITGLYWFLYASACVVAGMALFKIREKLFPQNRAAGLLCKVGYVGVLLVLIRFYWGRGMFSFHYYEYGSMYYPVVLLLITVLLAGIYCLVQKDVCIGQKVLAMLVIVQIFVTPLGSNNNLYPIINNLFVAIPFVLWVGYDWFRLKKVGFACKAPLVLLGIWVFIQSVGFHAKFVFADGVWGDRVDKQIEYPAKAAGVCTNTRNGETLEELAAYAETAELADREAIFFGNIPGLGYLLDMPSALSTFWADLDSYRMEEYERDMRRIETERIDVYGAYPVIILDAAAARVLEDYKNLAQHAEALDNEEITEWRRGLALREQKEHILWDFMETYGYQECYSNEGYKVYEAE